ncbi:hypothetical protein KOAAANKH_00130 [Brevundimonas sp. NIBR10]|uniref:hypothetical protein n=1 Tax=Brevundimonas sp. NIBR10 TaxID=3015997 RepID=UPI0022F155CE|nr:hypothetical protein [Brevundimonas sp. NIBR10]WGM45269.1 hypothetical protein KOAAANKH_00130 [Brevundimonas sp. NIBR10]
MPARPWIEATAFLAAHGFPVAAEHSPRRHNPWRYRMPEQARFAIIRPTAAAKPIVFDDLNALARWIQRERGEQGLDLVETEDLELENDLGGRLAVHVYTTDAGDNRDRNLGTAWLDGRGLETLQAALRRNRLVIQSEAA